MSLQGNKYKIACFMRSVRYNRKNGIRAKNALSGKKWRGEYHSIFSVAVLRAAP